MTGTRQTVLIVTADGMTRERRLEGDVDTVTTWIDGEPRTCVRRGKPNGSYLIYEELRAARNRDDAA